MKPTRRQLLASLPLLPVVARAAVAGGSDEADLAFLERVGLSPGDLYGEGLDGRLSYDLSRVVGEGLVTPNDSFYIRTREPAAVAARATLDDWQVRVVPGGDASGHQVDFASPTDFSIAALRQRSRPMGSHVLECSGNTSRTRFGLLSMAEWSGVPLQELFAESLWNLHSSTLIEIRGNDDHAKASRSSIQGASWIFTAGALRDAGAFLATGMNGETLPRDHGAPVRLIVPNWYGCACIKWVEEITVVPFNAPATSQMREFASRTHQDGRPELASDYIPAVMDFTAMPILVEGPDEQHRFTVHGIAWGDPTGVSELEISYAERTADPDARRWMRVQNFAAQKTSEWALWSHRLPRPSKSLELEIRLRTPAEGVRTRRLDSGFYARRVRLG
ncbi:MAG: molybdopterin-dependent oxidoreductase [Acidobacteriota bacterium]